MGAFRLPLDWCFIGGCRVVAGRRHRFRLIGSSPQATAALFFQPVAVAADRYDMAVVQQPIEDRRRHHLVAVGEAFSEGVHLIPLLHGAAGADQDAALLVAAGDQLEEQVPCLEFEGEIAQLIDDQQFRLPVLRQPHPQRPLLLA